MHIKKLRKITNPTETLVTSDKMNSGKAEFPFEQTLINRSENKIVQVTQLKKDKSVTTVDSLSLAKQNFEFLAETKTILGYKCQKAKTIINSNAIELWYTNELEVKGAPTVLGQNIGLVLEMVRNGNFVISATKIEKIKSINLYSKNSYANRKPPGLAGKVQGRLNHMFFFGLTTNKNS